MASRSADGNWNKKYDFETLELGETKFYSGNPKAIRTSASMWGRRYGVFLHTKVDGNRGCWVTRAEAPRRESSRRQLSIEQRLKRIEDSQRFICVILCKLKLKLAPEE